MLLAAVLCGGLQSGDEGTWACLAFRVAKVAWYPCVRKSAPGVAAHPFAGDRVERLALQGIVEHERSWHSPYVAVRGRQVPLPPAEGYTDFVRARRIAQEVPQQSIEFSARPTQFGRGRKQLGSIWEIANRRRIELIGAKEHLHPNPAIGAHVHRCLQQAANDPVHRLPVVGTPVQGVVGHHAVAIFSVQASVFVGKHPIDQLRIGFHIGDPTPPVRLLPDRVLPSRYLPCLHRSPNYPGLCAAPQEILQHVLAGIVVDCREYAETLPQLGPIAQSGTLPTGMDHVADRTVLKRGPPERLTCAAHARNHRDVGVKRLQVRLGEVDVRWRGRFPVAGSVRQLL